MQGVDADLRVRPFFAHGQTISIREFVVGALHGEMGMDAADPDLAKATSPGRVTTPAGMVLDGTLEKIEAAPIPNPAFDPDGNVSGNEVPTAVVDYLEFYLLNYFKPATYKQTDATQKGLRTFKQIGCASCHVPDLQIDRDRRVADVETAYDSERGNLNNLFATATALADAVDDGSGYPALKKPKYQPFLVRNILTDFKRHDLGPNFYERNWDGTLQKEFLTRPLWGVGSKVAYGHDGRSINLTEVILRHGNEAPAGPRCVRRPGPGAQAGGPRVPAVPDPVPARRHGLEPGSRRSEHARTSRSSATAASSSRCSSTTRRTRSEVRFRVTHPSGSRPPGREPDVPGLSSALRNALDPPYRPRRLERGRRRHADLGVRQRPRRAPASGATATSATAASSRTTSCSATASRSSAACRSTTAWCSRTTSSSART